jgi:hypothetical protein
MASTALGKIWVNSFNIADSSKGKNLMILNNSMINGKKDIMIKKAACAEKAAT